MKKKGTHLLFLLTHVLLSISVFAGTGDTTKVQVHNNTHMNWYGAYDQTGIFPSDSNRYSKIIMHYRLGCPTNNCSAWDYTTEITALVPTGQMDSTLHTTYLYQVNGNHPDTIYYNIDTSYVTFYNASLPGTDSMPASIYKIMVFGDSLNLLVASDSLYVWPGNYYNYIFNMSGTITDSVFVSSNYQLYNTAINYYTAFEIKEHIELGRVITPYGGSYPNSWSNTYDFDVTDYAPILHDSLEIRAFYSGWSDGFTVTLNFDFIEGIPPRDAIRVRNLYNGSFPYGDPNNSIENYLVPKTMSIDSNELMAYVKITPTGHGYDNQECAEFCSKDYQLMVNGTLAVNQAIWRDDCGMNSLFHQAGTWIYDRANWCPGDKGIARSHNLTTYITPGNPVDIDMNLQPYTAVGGSPVYTIAADLFTFGQVNFSADATIEEIIAPNSNPNYVRFNPICSHPIIVIKNTGSTLLTSALITYGIEGSTPNYYNWTGSLFFGQTDRIELDNIIWNVPNSGIFRAIISQPNGGIDQYPYNDTLRSMINFTPQLPNRFVFLLRTNNAPNETTWDLKDDAGTILFQNGALLSNHTYFDTLNLNPGCYTFTLYDSDKDGLSFFNNNDGNGYARFMDAYTPNVYLKSFTADFGTRISQQFTVGFTNGIQTPVSETPFFHIFPNPGIGKITLDMALPKPEKLSLFVYSLLGKKVYELNIDGFNGQLLNIDLTSQPSGVYFLKAVSETMQFSQKFVIEK